MKKLPLKNTETKNIPFGARIQKEIARSVNKPSKSVKERVSRSDEESNGCQFEKPSLYTTLKLQRAIRETKNQQPNINRMVEDKLASPNTAKYLRKKKASKVCVAETKNIYQDLVSLDVSGSGLIRGIEEDLWKRACNAQPPPRSVDPEPSLTDYFREEEFLNVRKVVPSDIFPLPDSKMTFTTDRKSLASYTNIFLGKNYPLHL